jgi:hypothetical protein
MYIFTYFCIIELVSGENQQINIPSFNIFYRNNYKHTDNAIPEIVMMNGSKTIGIQSLAGQFNLVTEQDTNNQLLIL